MQVSLLSAVISLGLALALCPQSGQAQSERDFVFIDEDGHLVIRFAGTGAAGLDSSQAYEVLNAEFSSMVHDRLHADLVFQDEPRDLDWAALMEPQIEEHVEHAGPEFSDVFIECRAYSCRLILEQPIRWTVPDHQAVLQTVQESLEAFIAARQQLFEPVFMITAYDKGNETPHIKAFLRRTGYVPPSRPGSVSAPMPAD